MFIQKQRKNIENSTRCCWAFSKTIVARIRRIDKIQIIALKIKPILYLPLAGSLYRWFTTHDNNSTAKQMFRGHKGNIFIIRAKNEAIKVPKLREISWFSLFSVGSSLAHYVSCQLNIKAGSGIVLVVNRGWQFQHALLQYTLALPFHSHWAVNTSFQKKRNTANTVYFLTNGKLILATQKKKSSSRRKKLPQFAADSKKFIARELQQ